MHLAGFSGYASRMMLDYYGLKEAPFSITPDPRFVFLSERHRDALAHLLYGIGKGGSGGFVLLTGEVGTGKTTICRLLLEQLPEHTQVAMVLNPKISAVELLETIAEELKLDIQGARGSTKMLIDRLTHYLLDAYAQGLRVVLIIDEAQNLSIDALEQVRLLTNLETPTQKLLQILLLGQPELRALLAKPELRQLTQRITARYHLTPLSSGESEAYVRHRLAVAGCKRFPFSAPALSAMHKRAQGVPRLLNVIGDRALTAGYAREQLPIGPALVEEAADEVLGQHRRRRFWPMMFIGTAVAALLLTLVPRYWPLVTTPAPTPAAPAPPKRVTLDEILDQDRPMVREYERQLAGRWLKEWSANPELSDRVLLCPERLDARLRCWRGKSNLTQLGDIDRPVFLLLRDGGDSRWVRLVGVDLERIALDFGSRRERVGRAELEQRWLGDFIGLYAPAVSIEGPLALNAEGPAVTWLHLRLRDFDQVSLPTNAVFDEATRIRVLELQHRFGLSADGVVGSETLWLLASRDPNGPRLRKPPFPP